MLLGRPCGVGVTSIRRAAASPMSNGPAFMIPRKQPFAFSVSGLASVIELLPPVSAVRFAAIRGTASPLRIRMAIEVCY